MSKALADSRACPCGWLGPAIWFISGSWLLCVPVGFLIFLIVRFLRTHRMGEIRFRRLKHGGSWSAYFREIHAVQGSPDEACHPRTIHRATKVALGTGAAVCHLMGIRSLSGGEQTNGIVLLVTGSVLGFLAMKGLKSRIGRRMMVALSSTLSASRGYAFALDEGGAVRKFNVDPQRIGRVRRSLTEALLGFAGTIQVIDSACQSNCQCAFS